MSRWTTRKASRKLGYLAIYTGTAQLTRPGQIAKVTLTDSARETLQGDVLVSEDNMTTIRLQAAFAGAAGRGQDHRGGGRRAMSRVSTMWSRSIAAPVMASTAAPC